MKNYKLHTLFFLFACLVNYTAKLQNSYEVTFNIHDYEYSTIYILGYCGSKSEIMDSVNVSKDGSFVWQADDYPMGMYMVRSPKGDMFSFVLEKSEKFAIEVYINGDFVVNNSPENDAYFLYQRENKRVQTAMYYYKLDAQANPDKADSLRQGILKIIDGFEQFQKNFFATYPDNIITVVTDGMNQSAPAYFFENGKLKEELRQEYTTYYRQHYWDRFHFKDNRILYTPYFIKQFNNYISEITLQEADTVCKAIDEFIVKADSQGGKEYADYVIAWYLENLPSLPFSFNEIIYDHIIKQYLERASTYLLPSAIEFHTQRIEKIRPFLPGKLMPNIILNDFTGVRHKLYSLKNEYTVIYFFSSSCESCKKNLEDLVNFYKFYKDEYDVQVYSIDIEPDYNLCAERQKQEPFDWIVTHASVEELRPYNFNLDHTPELFILDKNKRIINKTAIYDHVKKTIENDRNSKKQ